MYAETTRIPISVRDNTIICGTNGGNVRGHGDDRIVWFSGDSKLQWTLRFFPLGLENERAPRVPQLSAWPFKEPEPPGGAVGPTSEFAGTLREVAQPEGFKYALTIGNLTLDPIIIVDS